MRAVMGEHRAPLCVRGCACAHTHVCARAAQCTRIVGMRRIAKGRARRLVPTRAAGVRDGVGDSLFH